MTPRPEKARPSSPALPARLFASPYLLLGVTMLSWGGNVVAGRLAVGELSPMALTCLRWLIVMVLILPLARERLVEEWPVLRRHWPAVLLMGVSGYTAFNALFYVAAHYTTGVHLAIIQGAMPVLVIIGAFLLHSVKVRLVQAIGVAATLLGVAVVATNGEIASLRDMHLQFGDGLMLIACVLYAGYTLALRNRPPVSGLAFFAGMSVVAFATSIPLLLWEYAQGAVQWPTAAGWALLLYIGVFPSLLAQLFFMRAVELIGPGRAGLFINLVPVLGAMLSVLILGEPFGLYHAVALALVLGGISLAERFRVRPRSG